MTLQDQLCEILAREGVLPPDPDDAILGSKLLEKVQDHLSAPYSANSIRQTFSVLAADPTSPIARVAQGFGYYRRPAASVQAPISDEASDVRQPSAPPVVTGGREAQPEEKFRAFFLRLARLRSGFPVRVEHTSGAHQPAGVNKWKFPDVVVLDWEVGDQSEDGFVLDRALLEVKRSLGEQPFRLSSIELKVDLTLGNFREFFFQCVSNSKWAHLAQLVVATPISDALLVSELRRLGASYGVSVSYFPLPRDRLDGLPSASTMLTMPEEEFEKLAVGITATSIATGTPRADLDWDHIRDMRAQSPEFRTLFDWVARCLRDSRAYTFENFVSLQRIESEAG
jgi:hypothetical protein